MIKNLFSKRLQRHSDAEVVTGLQGHDRHMEEWFYRTARRYFDEHFNEVFFDRDKRQEIFQQAFLKLWMEIDNRRIRVAGEQVCRLQGSGELRPMTCALTTFLMAFARTEHRELVRNVREQYQADLADAAAPLQADLADEDADEQKNRIVDECIGQLSPSCAEILTLFYYKGMSLDDILALRTDRNSSKNGLKTAKNKCMNTLRERVSQQFQKYNLTA